MAGVITDLPLGIEVAVQNVAGIINSADAVFVFQTFLFES
jgi:hypothetical protein